VLNDSRMTRRGLILFVLLGVAWGIPYLLIKIAVGQLNPAVALVAGAVVLGEPVTGWSLAGFALILAGCCLVAVRRRTSGCDPAAEFGRPVVSG